MIILDTAQELRCFVCEIPIWPSEPKIVLGAGQECYVMHVECAPYLPVDNSVDKILGKMERNE